MNSEEQNIVDTVELALDYGLPVSKERMNRYKAIIEKERNKMEITNNCKCSNCGKMFHLKPSAIKRFKTHCCSQECNKEFRRKRMSGAGNHQYGLKGNKNASWKNQDRKMNKRGYVLKRETDHPLSDKYGYILEHRLVAEKYLLTESNSIEINGKRYLSKEYVVHHKNFDRCDNRVQNLEVMTKKEHIKLHCLLNPKLKNKNTGRFEKRNMEIKIKKVTETAIVPEIKSEGAAGFDLYVDCDTETTIKPHETRLLQTNIAFEIPKGYMGGVFARSGLSTKMGLRPATCVSVIDSDYRGSVGLPIHNDTNEEKIIKPYERVAQMIIIPVPQIELVQVDTLSDTERGSNGFGSTGK